jgi:glycosyltransferase involved in cell wall biosynthesis
MKVLFLYRYGILGGVCTQLFHRLRHLPKSSNLEIHCGFRSDHGVKGMLEGYATLHFGLNKETTTAFLQNNNFDLIIIIDTEEYIESVEEADTDSKVLVEVHTSIERNLEYLTRINPDVIDGFVTVSNYMVGRIKHHISDELQDKPISIFTNVLDSDLFSNISVDVDGPPIIGWVGKIDDHKDWRAFMQISKIVSQEHSGAEFWIIGGQTCPENKVQEVFDFAEEMGIISRFRWIDRIENVKMSSLYSLIAKRGGLSLVTSHCESFGMSVLESLLSGCPVVSTNVGALPEIIPESSYFQLYELGDHQKGAQKAVEIIGKSSKINQELQFVRDELITKYDSSMRSIEYWNMLQEMVK